MLQTGMSSRVVARALNSCHSTILRLWTLFQQTGDVSERPKTGRRGSRPLYKTNKFSYVFLIKVKSFVKLNTRLIGKELTMFSEEILILFLR